ncbi:class II aldolase/adducin family protein [Amycolatopsis halotolerans]|uniref:Class II aldolase/adducin family protein n=1 Tax=Amycolatopsis halotolerans TaxID=330083 RepID=A0ABV7QQB2_9PSEU
MSTQQELVALSSRILAAAGQGDLIWGDVSCRDADGRGVWIKSAEWRMEEVTPERVHLVNADGEVVSGGGPRHSEYPIHTEVIAARPEVNAVVHTHAPHAVVLAATGQELRPVSHAANLFVPPEVPRYPETADLILTPELGKSLAAELGNARAVFLVNHGIVAVGDSVESATVAAVVLDRACEQQLLTQSFGGWPSWSPPEESGAHLSPTRGGSSVGLLGAAIALS